jgi:hypothetical protein
MIWFKWAGNPQIAFWTFGTPRSLKSQLGIQTRSVGSASLQISCISHLVWMCVSLHHIHAMSWTCVQFNSIRSLYFPSSQGLFLPHPKSWSHTQIKVWPILFVKDLWEVDYLSYFSLYVFFHNKQKFKILLRVITLSLFHWAKYLNNFWKWKMVKWWR